MGPILAIWHRGGKWQEEEIQSSSKVDFESFFSIRKRFAPFLLERDIRGPWCIPERSANPCLELVTRHAQYFALVVTIGFKFIVLGADRR